MNKYTLLFTIIFIPYLTFGQTKGFNIKKISHKTFSFPLASGGDSVAAYRINTLLQLSELALLKGHEQHDIFEVVRTDNGGLYGGKTDISYDILENNGGTLSIQFYETSSGMTMHYWYNYYTFNAANGDLISLQDLFTSTGYKKFRTLAFSRQTSEYKKELKENHYSDTIVRYLPEGFKDIEYIDFYIKDGAIFLDAKGLLSKNEFVEFVISGINLITKIKHKEFDNLLNDYGKAVFANYDNLKKFRSQSMPQLMTGRLDNYPIIMLLKHYNQTKIIGLYAYLKNGIGIELSGSSEGNKFHLTEQDKQQKEIANIDLIVKNNIAIGTWKGKNGKTYNLTASQ